MKKTITTGVGLLLLLGSMQSFSQEKIVPNKELLVARIQIMEGSKTYNPTVALATFQKLANQGNAEAMNGLGLIYSRGMGVPVNEALGLDWFEKAGQNGYAKAYFNIAMLYKNGVGTAKDEAKTLEYYKKAAQTGYTVAYYFWGKMVKDGTGTSQDYSQAIAIFKHGAEKGDAHCLYIQGYMHYKGFGTAQDYGKAVELFQQASDKKDAGGMYMLGLCYRNGYGIDKNETKGLEWLKKSADLGLKEAKLELAEPQAENATPNQTKTVSVPLPEEVENAPAEPPVKMEKVKQKISTRDISGAYTGYLIRYDWSGQNLISKTELKVSLDQKGKVLIGEWEEKEGDKVSFNAQMNDKSILFENSKIERTEHFYKNTPRTYEFKEAQLQYLEKDGMVYIAGNIQLYDIKEHENEKPMYVILERKADDTETAPADQIVSHLVVYPNPVTADNFKLSFDVAQQTDISLRIYDFNGNLKHQQELPNTNVGQKEQTVSFNAPANNYILNLYYGSQVIRTILIKK